VALKGATQAVLVGVVSATVVNPFTAPYEIGVTPGWATDTFVVPASKTAAQFIVQFTVPAPAGGSSFDWGVLDSA
jgi:hypothetical protein